MLPSKQNIESLTGMLAVGSLGVLGVFLIIDGQTNIFLIFEQYGKSTSWGIFAAVPILVISYLFGLYLTQVAEILFRRITQLNSVNSEQQFVCIAQLKNENIMERYSELIRQKKLLEGSSIAFILLSLGALSEVNQMQDWEVVAYVGSVIAFVVALISPLLAITLSNKIERLVIASSDMKIVQK